MSRLGALVRWARCAALSVRTRRVWLMLFWLVLASGCYTPGPLSRAVRSGDLPAVEDLLRRDPELAKRDRDAVDYALSLDQPASVRLAMLDRLIGAGGLWHLHLLSAWAGPAEFEMMVERADQATRDAALVRAQLAGELREVSEESNRRVAVLRSRGAGTTGAFPLEPLRAEGWHSVQAWALWRAPAGERLVVYDSRLGGSAAIYLGFAYAFDSTLTRVDRGTNGGVRSASDPLSLVEFRSTDPRVPEPFRGAWHLGTVGRKAARAGKPLALVRDYSRWFAGHQHVAPIDWESDRLDWSSVAFPADGFRIDEIRLVYEPPEP